MIENSKRNYKLIISIIITLLVLGGVTYAAWYYLTEKTHVVMNIDGDRINFNAGEDLTVNNMMPVYTMEEGVSKTIEIYQESTNYTAGINLFMNLKTWPIQLSDNSFRWALYKNDKYMTSGSFVNKKQGDTIKLTSVTQKLNTVDKKDTYKLYMWIDAYQESNINMMNKSFTISIYGQASFYDQDEEDIFTEDKAPNPPELAEGMIPIKYNYLIDEWQKADSTNTDNDWYNYNEQYWANAVMVTSDSRERYMNASVGTTVLEEDILAYYVWIPRYRYLLFNVNSETIDPREIQLEFQKKTDEISNGTQNGEWLTHPAFWWDNNSNGEREEGEELSGIWVGKFKTGGTLTTPLVKPNVKFVLDRLSSLFNMNKNINSSSYLTENGLNEIDAHMMKNIDWGALTYLSHSKYGINTEVCVNNSSDYITGRSGAAVGGSVKSASAQYLGLSSSHSSGYYTYNDFVIDYLGNITISKEPGKGICSSTTGNVTGVFDAVGSYYEYVMALMKTSSGSFPSAGGFNQNNKPDYKYYDFYEYGSTNSYEKRILGDATGETRGWYKDYSRYFYSNLLVRGNSSDFRNGMFAFGHMDGALYTSDASRSVLVLP